MGGPSTGCTVNTKVVRGTLGIAASAGIDRVELATRAGIDLAVVDDPDARIPWEAWLQAWQIIEEKTKDRLIALKAASLPKGHFDVIDYVFAASDDLGSALTSFSRYFALISTAVEHRFEGNVMRRVHAPGAFTKLPYPAEFGFASLIGRTRDWTERAWHPLRVELAHAAPEDLETPRRIFGCKVVYDAPESRIYFDPSSLRLRMRTPEPELVRILDGHARAALERLPRAMDFVESVRDVLAKELRGGAPNIHQCARRLGTSVRSLQRRLAEAKTSYDKLLDEVRRTLALRYLEDRSVSISEVGFLLGFQDASAFYRAFRRWTGQTPARHRAMPNEAQPPASS